MAQEARTGRAMKQKPRHLAGVGFSFWRKLLVVWHAVPWPALYMSAVNVRLSAHTALAVICPGDVSVSGAILVAVVDWSAESTIY